MEKETLRIFLEIRESFHEIKERVSLLRPYFELHFSSPGMAMRLEEFENLLGFTPGLVYRSKDDIYGISVLYTIDDDVTKGIIAHEFAELVARENGIHDHESIDEICVEKGFGLELLHALENVLLGRVERSFIDTEDLRERISGLKSRLKKASLDNLEVAED